MMEKMVPARKEAKKMLMASRAKSFLLVAVSILERD